MIKDRVAFDLPLYDGLLAGHYVRGQGYGRRRPGGTDDWLLVMTLAGAGRFGTETGDIEAERGSMMLLSPGTTHDYGTAREVDLWEILWVHFQPPPTWFDLLQWPLVAAGVHSFTPETPIEIEQALREVRRLSVSTGSRRREFAMNALERLLLLCDAQLPNPERRIDDRIKASIEYIHAHLQQPLTLVELSERVHLSSYRFAHLFREEMGVPPKQYIQLQRLQRARSLLERTTLGVAEIADQVGMDPFHFSLRFKQQTGKSPRAYRLDL
jgi:AraC family transcriptional regulator of arabinose operon